MAAVAALPGRQRHVFALRELHGLRIEEIAAELHLTAQQVEQSLFAARNRLAEQLVFGERLGCAAVRKLAAGPLDLRERRALKTHVRSCPACRKELGGRGIALAAMPLPSLHWLRALGGGGAPVALKIGAVAATATVVAGAPVLTPHAPRSSPHVMVGKRERGPDVPLAVLATRPGPPAARVVRPTKRLRPARPAKQARPADRIVRVTATPVPAAPAPPPRAPESRPVAIPTAFAAPPAASPPTTTTATTTTTDPGTTDPAPTTTSQDPAATGDSSSSSSDGGGDTTTTDSSGDGGGGASGGSNASLDGSSGGPDG
jgi:uncharacterized membrane protein YgcG